jgi:hypothetical protein
MCNHIVWMGMSNELGHYNTYMQKCLEGKIEMHVHCIPDDKCKCLECEGDMSDNKEQCITPAFTHCGQY